ncbi:unnamed protein product [Linum trigynum]|uniref:Uncharacterized protein n=1 Tax=Linum trigynum TaxID=586398 RepID=A0AAV2GCF3_9ROSI
MRFVTVSVEVISPTSSLSSGSVQKIIVVQQSCSASVLPSGIDAPFRSQVSSTSRLSSLHVVKFGVPFRAERVSIPSQDSSLHEAFLPLPLCPVQILFG